MRCRIWIAGLLSSVASLAAASPSLVADYRFANNLQSSVAGAPDLALVGSGTSYASEQVLYYTSAQTVLAFSAGSGVSLSPATMVLPDAGIYTIALQARITGVSSDGYSKFIDFSNGVADVGLYDNGGLLEFYSYPAGSTIVIDTKYADIVLTRDSNGMLAGYYKGLLQFTIDDSANQWGVVDASDTLRFFLDDHVGAGTEATDGAVARIRIWDDALDAEAVKQLTDPIFADGFEGTM